MCQLVGEALDAGAAGFSTSFSFAHRGVDGKPVPSRFAERDEVEALFAAAGKAGKGVVLATPGEQCSYPDFYELQRADRAAVHLAAVRGARATHTARSSRSTRSSTARGANVWPQVTPRPLTMQFTLADAYSLNVGQVFGELLEGEPRGAHGGLPRSRLAGARGGGPGQACRCGRAGRPSRCPSRSGSPSCRAGV